MAIDPRDKARWEQRQKDEMRDAAENAKPFTSMAEWQAHYLPNSKPEIEELPQLATSSAVVLDERAIPANCDVRKILLRVVPGDGNGHEVYARNVTEVEELLSEMGERLDLLDDPDDGLLQSAVDWVQKTCDERDIYGASYQALRRYFEMHKRLPQSDNYYEQESSGVSPFKEPT